MKSTKTIKTFLLFSFLLSSNAGFALTCPPAETVKQMFETKKGRALQDKFTYDQLTYQVYDATALIASTNLENFLKTDFKITASYFTSAATNLEGSSLVCSYEVYFYSLPYMPLIQFKIINLFSSNVNTKHGGFINPNTSANWGPHTCSSAGFGGGSCVHNKPTVEELETVRCGYSGSKHDIHTCAFNLGASIKK